MVTAGVQSVDAAIRSGWAPPGAELTKPATLPWPAAGALSASGQTAHTALARLGVTRGETVLVHGAAGGVGTMFVQLARERGARVIGTASADNHDHIRALGGIPVEYGTGQLGRILAHAPQGVDAVLDAAGHDNLLTAVQLVNDRRRIGTIVDMQLAQHLGCQVIRSDRSAARLTELLDLVAAGSLQVSIRRTCSLEEAAVAHREIETGHGHGKLVLLGGPEPIVFATPHSTVR